MNRDTEELVNIAKKAALKAGALIKEGFSTNYSLFAKEGVHNLVTEYDLKAEKLITAFIKDYYPNDNFVCEEGGSTSTSSPVTWIIDPLDGTVNFAHKIPFFSVSIAACIDDKPIAAAVYIPMTQELFSAAKGGGAYLGSHRLQVSSTENLQQAFLATGFPYNLQDNPHNCIESLTKILSIGLPVRRLGSAAIDLCYTAAGRFDGYFEVSLQPWDVAAGHLIVEEAGGKITNYIGNTRATSSKEPILASNNRIHNQLVDTLKGNYD